MSKNKKLEDEFDMDEEKIYFDDLFPSCFACGFRLNEKTKICPYCETKLI